MTDTVCTDADPGPGEYRRWDGVRLADRLLVSTSPLAVTRLNAAAADAVAALANGAFHAPGDIAAETGLDRAATAQLFDRLHQRGFLEWRPARDPTHTPPVSVVVTVRNDRANLRVCLDALHALDYPDYEVVVVDDGSTDGTPETAADHPLAATDQLRVVRVGSSSTPIGIGAARNRGVAAAAHDVVAFTDADCRPRASWLADLVPCLAHHDLVGGRVRPAGDTAVSAYEGINSSLDMGAHAARVDPASATPYLATANLIGHRRVFEVARFPERDVAEDVAVCRHALALGFDVVYTPHGVVEHAYRHAAREFAGRRADYGASEALLAAEDGTSDGGRVPVSTLTAVGAVALLAAALLPADRAVVVLFAAAGLTTVGAVGPGIRLWRRTRSLSPAVSRLTVATSWIRERLSRGYAAAREVTRYYALPLLALGAAAFALGAHRLAGVVLAGTVFATTLPAVVEYRIHAPVLSRRAYAGYYLLDHLGYQYGVYRGTVDHGTLTHLVPWHRFELVGPVATRLPSGGDAPRPSRTHTVTVAGVAATFRLTSSTEAWWFRDPDLRGERPVLRDLLDTLDAEDVFLDVGANVGLYSCLVGQTLPNRHVVAVEPHPTNADRLTSNLALNGVTAHVVRRALAATTATHVLTITSETPGDGTHSLATAPPTGDDDTHSSSQATARALKTDVTTGDALFTTDSFPRPTVVKVDVEGTELDVLEGLSRTLSRDACRLVYCEVHAGVPQSAVAERLCDHGFDVTTLHAFPDGRITLRALRPANGA